MIKPDVVVTWPRHCDYPIWRRSITTNRERFDQVFIAFTDHHVGHDYREFVSSWLGAAATCFDAPVKQTFEQDWRDLAVNEALRRSRSEWVWFTEQDLEIRYWDLFWKVVDELVSLGEQAMGWRTEGPERWHPSCLLARRDLIARTTSYFGPTPLDHFVRFSREIDKLTAVADLGCELAFAGSLDTRADVTHMAGLSRNHELIRDGKYDEVYKPDEMYHYLRECLKYSDLHPSWMWDALEYVAAVTS